MLRGAALFAAQLAEAGVAAEVSGDWVAFPYAAPSGRYAASNLRVAVAVPRTFPDDPPGGIHVHPRQRANNDINEHPGRVANSDRGADWEYWSRPFPKWGKESRKDAWTYRRFVDHLLATTP
jgi:hypothetical protein